MTTPSTFKLGYPQLKYSTLPSVTSESNPAASDIYHPTVGGYYPIPTLWTNTTNDAVFVLTSIASGTTANWEGVTDPGSGNVDGPAVSVDNALAKYHLTTGKIIQNSIGILTDAGVLTGLTSVESPIYTSLGALAINMPAGAFDMTIKMADAAGAQKISFTDSAAAEKASLNSSGKFTAVNLVGIIGATGSAAGTFTTALASTSLSSPIWTSTGSMALNVPTGAFDATIKLGDNIAGNTQKLSFTDSDGIELAKLKSGGQLELLKGDFVEVRSSAAAEVKAQVTNSDNTSTDSDAFVEVAVGGTSSGNPGIRFQISAGQNYSMGIDNADADKLVVCGNNDLGTDVLMKMDAASTKDIEVTQGNLVIALAAKQLQMNGGAVTDFIGQATLVAGTVTIANTNIATGDRIFVTRSSLNASPALGDFITTISASTSFTVASYDALGSLETTDVSGFDYFIVRQN